MNFANRLRRLEQTHGPQGCICHTRTGRQVVRVPSGASETERAAILKANAPEPCPEHGPCPIVIAPPLCTSVDDWLSMVGLEAAR